MLIPVERGTKVSIKAIGIRTEIHNTATYKSVHLLNTYTKDLVIRNEWLVREYPVIESTLHYQVNTKGGLVQIFLMPTTIFLRQSTNSQTQRNGTSHL